MSTREGSLVIDIKDWLHTLGLDKYIEIFNANDIELEVAPHLTEQDLVGLGLSLGHRKKFLAEIAKLKADLAAAPPAEQAPPEAVSQLERRQVTVAFTDLVGSTAIAGEMDPEDLNRLLQSYRDTCAAVIAKYDGYIAQYLGDGVLAYFGFPIAQEDAAERAVRAGLEIVKAVGSMTRAGGAQLQSRVGIATGLVAAGDMVVGGVAREQTVVGETPNLAARLQAMSEPGGVLVSPATYRLTSNLFEYTHQGEHQLKGFTQAVAAWQPLGERSAESRFAARSAAAAPIVARERESAFLIEAWQRARHGDGHMVLVSGEAGMGKSRLLESLVEQLQGEAKRLLRCQCSPHHANSALYPFKQLLRRAADLRPGVPDVENLKRIADLLARFGRSSRPALLLMAELLEVPTADVLSPMEMTLAQRNVETLAILEDFLLAAIDGATALVLLEDAHWSDPTTKSLVDSLLKRIGREHSLVLITFRPELRTDWASHPNATALTCKQLGPAQCIALVRQVAEPTTLDDTLVEQIVARSDGVPLFLEELTKAVLEQQSQRTARVPETLQDSLMARLDRLGRAKDIAQVASVIGRQFTLPLLEAILGWSSVSLGEGLRRLQEAGLVLAVGGPGELEFSFNHALVQEAAYDSLSRERRQLLHRRVAVHLEVESSVGSEPALLAHHLACSGDAEGACRWWIKAADRSTQRLAFAEALAALGSALAQADLIADPAHRVRQVLEVQLKLGATYIVRSGPQSEEGAAALRRAHEIATEIDALPQLFQATWGLYLKAGRTRLFGEALARGAELNEISKRLADPDLEFESIHHRWGIAYFTGANADILTHTNDGLRRYDPERHHRLSYVFAGHDPGVCAHCVRAAAVAISGDSMGAALSAQAGVALAESLQHPLSIAFALGVAAHTMHVAGDATGTADFSERLIRVATKYDFEILRRVGAFMLGAARAMQDVPASSLRQMETEFEAAYGYGFMGIYPGLILADALSRVGRRADAAAVVSRMLDGSNTPEVGLSVSELWRLRGELELDESARSVVSAEQSLRTALRIASNQGAFIYVERAQAALMRLAG